MATVIYPQKAFASHGVTGFTDGVATARTTTLSQGSLYDLNEITAPTTELTNGEWGFLTNTLNAPQTISGPIAISIYGMESAMTTNAGLRARVYYCDDNGSNPVLLGTADDGVELSTAETLMTWSVTPTSTTVPGGKKLYNRIDIVGVGTLGSGTAYVLFGGLGTSLATFTFTENLTFGAYNPTRTGTGSNTATQTVSAAGNVKISGTGANTVNVSSTGAGADYTPRTGTGSNTLDPITTYFASSGTGANTAAVLSSGTGLKLVFEAKAGYSLGGYNLSSVAQNTTTKITYASEALSTLSMTLLSGARGGAAGFSSDSKGYSSNGLISGVVTTNVAGVNFSDDTYYASAAAIKAACQVLAGATSQVKGYVAGGSNAGYTTYLTTKGGYTYSTETATAVAATMAIGRQFCVGMESSITGYWCNGFATGDVLTGDISGLTFSTDTARNAIHSITAIRGQTTLSATDFAYLAGGHSGSTVGTVQKFAFVNETASGLGSLLTTGARFMGAGVESSEKGYIVGGSGVTYIDAIIFASDTFDNTAASLSGTAVFSQVGTSSYRPHWGAYTGAGINSFDVLSSGVGQVFFDSPPVAGTGANILDEFIGSGAGAGGIISGVGTSDVVPFTQSGYGIALPTLGIGAVTIAPHTGNGSGAVTTPTINPKVYICGGRYSLTTYYAIHGILESTDTSSTISGATAGAQDSPGFAQAGVSGYLFYGSNGTNTYYEFRFATETNASGYVGIGNDTTHYHFQSRGGSGRRYGYVIASDYSTAYSQAVTTYQYSTKASTVADAALSEDREGIGIMDTSNASYLATGWKPNATTTGVDKFAHEPQAYSNTSATVTYRNRPYNGGSSATKGYIGGGIVGATESSEIDGIIYATETSNNPSAALSVAREELSGAGATTKGYWAGGYPSSTEIDGITYSSEAAINPSSSLAQALYLTVAISNVSNAPLIPIGTSWTYNATLASVGTGTVVDNNKTGTGANTVTHSQIFTGSMQTVLYGTATNTCNDFTNTGAGGIGWGGTGASACDAITGSGEAHRHTHPGKAYFAAGNGINGDTIDKIDFGTEAVSYTFIFLTTTRAYPGSFSSSTKGYVTCGANGVTLNSTDGFLYSNETVASVATGLIEDRYSHSQGVESATAGYAMGGATLAWAAYYDLIEKLIFSTDIMTASTAVLAQDRYGIGCVSSPAKGYATSGADAAYSTEVDGILFSNDTAINPAAAMMQRYFTSSFPSGTRGYFCGGYSGAAIADIEALIFSSEAYSNPSATLAVARRIAGSAQSYTSGYSAGGVDASSLSSVERLLFSTETAAELVGTLQYARPGLVGVGYRAESYFSISTVNALADFVSAGSGVSNAGSPVSGTGTNTTTAFAQTTQGYRSVGGDGTNTVEVTSIGSGAVDGGLAPRTGTGANTVGDAASSCAGNVPVSGTGSGPVSISTSCGGAVRITGTCSASTNATSACVGLAPARGTGAASVSATSTSTGVVLVMGVSATAASASSTSAGTISITGMSDSAFIAFMQAALATLRVVGSGGSTAIDVTSSGYGYVTDYVPASHDQKMLGISLDHPVESITVATATEGITVLT